MSQRRHVQQEIEQWFLPTDETVERIMRAPDKVDQIVQGYLPRGQNIQTLTSWVNFEPEKSDVPETATLHYRPNGTRQDILTVFVNDPDKVAALKKASVEQKLGPLMQRTRLRCRKDKDGQITAKLTMKSERTDNVADEYEYTIARPLDAIRMMKSHCAEHLITKTRYEKKNEMIAGKPRTMELDIFKGVHAGKIKLEIEHTKEDDAIAPADVASFATKEVTRDPTWKNYEMSAGDVEAIHDLAVMEQLLVGPPPPPVARIRTRVAPPTVAMR